jgi:hypothetical protein
VMCNALIGGHQGEGNGRHSPNTSRPRSSRRWKYEYGVANQKEKPRSEDSGQAWRARRRCGAVRLRRISSCASRGVRSAMLWHRMCVGRRSSTREQENLEVRGGVNIADQSGYFSTTTNSRQASSSTMESHQRRAHLIANPIHRGNSLSACSRP